MLNQDYKTLAIDFDGTVVEHKFPAIGKERPFAIQTLLQLQKEGHHLILWTYRHGKALEEAVAFCASKGLEFYAVNKNYPEEPDHATGSRKILADIYIDDRNIGGFPGWPVVYDLLKNKQEQFLQKHWEDQKEASTQKKSRPSFLNKIFGK